MDATTLRLPNDIGERLSILSQQTGRSKTFYILEAIREHLDDIEDRYIAEQRLSELRAGRSRVLSSDEMEAMLRKDKNLLDKNPSFRILDNVDCEQYTLPDQTRPYVD